jgi:S-DNA-T family DNA segregation ATPase FtsK/SpoIIIE
MAKKINKKKAEKKDSKEKKKKKGGKLKSITSFIQSDKFKLSVGVFFLLFSLYLAFSFLSYFFFWTADYDIVYNFQWNDISNQVPVNNWGGFLGAWLAHLFIYKMFGLASILFVLLFFLMGSRLINYLCV